jgi:hypothetical protein
VSATYVNAPPIPARPPKSWLATLVVGAIMLAILIGGFVVEGAVPEPPPRPVSAGSGVMLTPISGWDFAGRSEDGQTILLTQGSGSLAVSVVPGTDANAALRAKRDEWLQTGTVTVSEPVVVALPGDRSGARFNYSGTFEDVPTPVEGAVTAVAGSNVVVLFDGWSGIGGYPNVGAEIDSMIESATIP